MTFSYGYLALLHVFPAHMVCMQLMIFMHIYFTAHKVFRASTVLSVLHITSGVLFLTVCMPSIADAIIDLNYRVIEHLGTSRPDHSTWQGLLASDASHESSVAQSEADCVTKQ